MLFVVEAWPVCRCAATASRNWPKTATTLSWWGCPGNAARSVCVTTWARALPRIHAQVMAFNWMLDILISWFVHRGLCVNIKAAEYTKHRNKTFKWLTVSSNNAKRHVSKALVTCSFFWEPLWKKPRKPRDCQKTCRCIFKNSPTKSLLMDENISGPLNSMVIAASLGRAIKIEFHGKTVPLLIIWKKALL